MKEAMLRKLAVPDMRAAGALVLGLHGHAMQSPGWPDLYVAHPRYDGWVELKGDGGSLSPLQTAVGKKLVERRVRAVVLNGDGLRGRSAWACGWDGSRIELVHWGTGGELMDALLRVSKMMAAL